MAIAGPSSYPPTMAQFVTHWDNVLVDPSIAGNFPLPDGTTRDQFNALRDQLVTFAASIQNRVDGRESGYLRDPHDAGVDVRHGW